MRKDFEYNGSADDDIIDENRIGRGPQNNYALIAVALGVVSMFLAITRGSGFLAVFSGIAAMVFADKALYFDKTNVLAKIGKYLGLAGTILGMIFIVTCVSCISCTARNLSNPFGYWRFRY